MNSEKRIKPFFRTFMLILLGVLAYGAFNKLFQNIIFPGADFIAFRPQLIIPVIVSLMVGPLAGGAIGLFGNFFGDLLSGFGFQFWHWSLANFLIGFMPGMVRWMGVKSIRRVNEFALVLLFVFIGNALGLFEGFMVHLLLGNGGNVKDVLYSWYLPALISNSYLLFLFMPPFLILFQYLKLNIETKSMFFVILFSLVIVSLISILIIGFGYHNLNYAIDREWMPEKQVFMQNMITGIFRWLGVLLICIVILGSAIGYYFSRKYMQPIHDLAKASDKVKQGNWAEADKIAVEKGSSEMVNLITLFNNMASNVQKREEKMSNVIRELQLKVDKKKEDVLYKEITETDFFKKLEKKSKVLREKRKNEK